MENLYRITLDVEVSFDISHGEVNLEFGDTQYDAEYELYAESEREAIDEAKKEYIDEMGQYMGKDFTDFVHIDFLSVDAEELDEEGMRLDW